MHNTATTAVCRDWWMVVCPFHLSWLPVHGLSEGYRRCCSPPSRHVFCLCPCSWSSVPPNYYIFAVLRTFHLCQWSCIQAAHKVVILFSFNLTPCWSSFAFSWGISPRSISQELPELDNHLTLTIPCNVLHELYVFFLLSLWLWAPSCTESGL